MTNFDPNRQENPQVNPKTPSESVARKAAGVKTVMYIIERLMLADEPTARLGDCYNA